MKLFAIGDLHLSFGENVDKPMDVFGGGWVGHTEKLYKNWNALVGPEDLVIICGDISWGLRPEEALADLDWIHALPGKKILFKGNHDLWWQSIGKLNKLYDDGTMFFMQNHCYVVDYPAEPAEAEIPEAGPRPAEPAVAENPATGPCPAEPLSTQRPAAGLVPAEKKRRRRVAICGTRGWICPGTDGFGEHDKKIYERELLRLRFSLEEGKASGADTLIGVLHYPPTNDKMQGSGFTSLFSEYGVKRCVYGHLHGNAFKHGIKGIYNGVEYQLVSLDYVEGMPKEVLL